MSMEGYSAVIWMMISISHDADKDVSEEGLGITNATLVAMSPRQLQKRTQRQRLAPSTPPEVK